MEKATPVFLFAMEKEAIPLFKASTVISKRRSGYASIYECQYDNIPFSVVISGIGKGFAAAAMTVIHYEFDHPEVYNFGVAGTLDDIAAPILSAVISSSFVEHDLDTSQIGDPVGLVSGINRIDLPASPQLMMKVSNACKQANISCALGKISSGDTFFAPIDPRKKEVIERFHPLSIDMESAPFAQIAYVYNIPFVAVRLISDAHHPETEYVENMGRCAENIYRIACKVLLSYAQ